MKSGAGGVRAVIEGALCAIRDNTPATLAIVVDTTGSTYVRRGAIALFGVIGKQVGWLSGGCLEPEIASRAMRAAERSCVEWMEIDTRDDEDLFAGSAVGCRGRLRLALLPVVAMDGWDALAQAWIGGAGALHFSLDAAGRIDCRIGGLARSWMFRSEFAGWQEDQTAMERWTVELPEPPTVLIFGAGPEIPLLVPLLRSLGWMTWLSESRPRWQANAEFADHWLSERPAAALESVDIASLRASLVMQHNFELDREALEVLAPTSVPFVGLLGPTRRRDDLFKLLSDDVREALSPRVRSPVGLDLGGHGPEPIALSIAAQLQASLRRT
jgi:xanthine dehydrogenase accessory factor